MNAAEIEREIERLAPEDQLRLVRFAFRLDAARQLTGPELAVLAAKLASDTDPLETAALRDTIRRGFYGGKPDA